MSFSKFRFQGSNAEIYQSARYLMWLEVVLLILFRLNFRSHFSFDFSFRVHLSSSISFCLDFKFVLIDFYLPRNMRRGLCHGSGASEFLLASDSLRSCSSPSSTIWFSSTISRWQCCGSWSSHFRFTVGLSFTRSTSNSPIWQSLKTWHTWG